MLFSPFTEYTSACMLLKSYTCSSIKSVFVVYSLTFNMRTNQVEITCNVLNNKDHYEIIENNEEKWSNTTAMFRQLLSPHLPQVICGRKECRGYLSFALSASSMFTPAYYTIKHCAIQLRWINYLGLEKKINPHNTIYKALSFLCNKTKIPKYCGSGNSTGDNLNTGVKSHTMLLFKAKQEG